MNDDFISYRTCRIIIWMQDPFSVYALVYTKYLFFIIKVTASNTNVHHFKIWKNESSINQTNYEKEYW